MKRFTVILIASLFVLSSACFGFDNIQQGDTGDTVTEIQNKLIELGYLSTTADGSFGKTTKLAVINFQQDNDLDATGIVGEATYQKLMGIDETDGENPDTDEEVSLPDVEITKHTERFPTDVKLSFNIYSTIQSAGRTLGYFTQDLNPELSFDASSQTVSYLYIYLTYIADCDENSARKPLEQYTDKLLEILTASYPTIDFEFISFFWSIPAIDEENLYSATFYCEKEDGKLKRGPGRGKIYPEAYAETEAPDTSNDNTPESSPAYDATLEYGTEGPVVFVSEDAMSRFTKAMANDNQGTVNDMFAKGEAAVVPNGTKCNIIKKTFATCQVQLVDGVNAGRTVWTVIEALHE